MARVGSIRIRVTIGETDAQGVCLATVFHGRRKVEEFETTQPEMKELLFRIREKAVPPKIAAAAKAAREAREDAGRTTHWWLIAAVKLTAPLGPPQPAF